VYKNSRLVIGVRHKLVHVQTLVAKPPVNQLIEDVSHGPSDSIKIERVRSARVPNHQGRGFGIRSIDSAIVIEREPDWNFQ